MSNLVIWENGEKIRKLFAPNLTTDELSFFMALGKNLGANPFTREIWAVKYDRNQPAAIFCGRDFYRRVAQEQADYEGHNVQSVYSNDLIEIENGEVKKHVPNLREPGDIIGAYCILWRSSKRPFFHLVRFREYFKGFSNWRSMPETMIKKVAEAQTLRMAYQGIFRGTYDESESWIDTDKASISSAVPEEKQVPERATIAETMNAGRKTPPTTPPRQMAEVASTTPATPTPEVSASLTIQDIAHVLKPELKTLFNARRVTTGQILTLWCEFGGDQQRIIDALGKEAQAA